MSKQSYKSILKRSIHAFFDISKREKRRILLLLPLLVLITILFAWQDKPRFEQGFTMYSNSKIEEKQNLVKESQNYSSDYKNQNTFDKSYKNSTNPGKIDEERFQSGYNMSGKDSLFTFDPNTIDLKGLVALGFSEKQARVIINYRNAGAIFRKPSDFAKCYTVSEKKFKQLLPYIKIADNTGSQAYSDIQAETSSQFNEYQNNPESITDTTALKGDRTQTKQTRLESHPLLLELNEADSAELVSIKGIGPLTAGRIIKYRNRLGGFASVSQLTEIKGMYKENYKLILQQIYVDSSKIKKIDINFALPQSMRGHPYIKRETLNKILKYRQLEGGWCNIGELIEQHILSEEEADKLSPYFYFRTK